ncbi:hypothetical protein IFM89_029710 [Coptis chinensis]|uniref:Helicase ATP-binding domain-containing protein n=1 Tax=Coptis chinensis TaxID=261450 RepID=A0A835LC44_9MAGN|nr:hypothetical protein IFM89_029710 [Coptis chinensis]
MATLVEVKEESLADSPTSVLEDENAAEKKKGRGKAAPQQNTRKAQKAVAAMLSRSEEGRKPEDSGLTEEEKVAKEQAELVPLLTGGKLKQYQLKGVKWMISLWQNGLNGILADQMGHGKTIQTIAFLAHLKGNGLDGPYLVIAPLSTLSNWVNEIEKFTPSINAIVYHGDKKVRDESRRKYMPRNAGPEFLIVITSYEVAMNDARRCLRHYQWKYVVVDEGHRLKNTKCKLLRELRYLHMENKLLLTGTPLQNNLAELWSLLNFLLPDIFSSHAEFESWFDLSGKGNSEAQQEELEEKRRLQVCTLAIDVFNCTKTSCNLRPFLLRRLKSEVEQLLPRKKEIILYANMTEHQKYLQEHLRKRTLENHLQEKGDGKNSGIPVAHGRRQEPIIQSYVLFGSLSSAFISLLSLDAKFAGNCMKGKLNNLMIPLRKNINHPDLLESAFDGSYLYPPVEQLVEQCGKFHLLDRLLTKLFARKHKVLIFSQWTKILDLIEYCFGEKGLEACRIDGSVKLDERKRQWFITFIKCIMHSVTADDILYVIIQEFNDVNRNLRIFLLSTRAGGLGINLTSADTCILYGSDWEEDLLAMLRDEEDPEEKLIQTGISNESLEKVLDRSI